MNTASKSIQVVLRSVILMLLLFVSCTRAPDVPVGIVSEDQKENAALETHELSTVAFSNAREKMVANQLIMRDIVNERVLAAMRKIPRHEFVPENMRDRAYADSPLPIGKGQTISQPYIVALMTQLVDPQRQHKVLDVGTGSGYQAAVLAELTDNVYSIEIVESLANAARDRLQKLGYRNISVRHGDGYHGWQSEAPFDVIVVAAAPDHIPQALIDQLAPGGRMVIPVGDFYQELMMVEKDQNGKITKREIIPVAFVPMTGNATK